MWMSEARASTRAVDQLVDEADDRRLAGQVLQPLGVLAAAFAVAEGIDDVAERAAGAAIEPLLSLLDIRRNGNAARNRLSRRYRHRARGEVVERVGHRQHDRLPGFRHRQDPAVLQELEAERAVEKRLVGKLLGRHERH